MIDTFTWTPEALALLAQMRSRNFTFAVIAKHLGCSKENVAEKIETMGNNPTWKSSSAPIDENKLIAYSSAKFVADFCRVYARRRTDSR